MTDQAEAERIIAEALTMDATRSEIVLFLGMKGRGKSIAARMLFDAWPYDRTVIDPTGNARPDDPFTVAFAAPFPSQLPEPDADADPPQQRVTVWARVSPRAPDFVDQQEQAMQMAMYPRTRRKLIWRDEFGLGTSANKIEPNDRAALMSSRHYNASLLLVVQRPVFIPKLAISQADKILMFQLPNPDDRELVAKNAGVPVPVLERAYQANQRRHRHAYLLIDRANNAVIDCPPLPNVQARGPAA